VGHSFLHLFLPDFAILRNPFAYLIQERHQMKEIPPTVDQECLSRYLSEAEEGALTRKGGLCQPLFQVLVQIFSPNPIHLPLENGQWTKKQRNIFMGGHQETTAKIPSGPAPQALQVFGRRSLGFIQSKHPHAHSRNGHRTRNGKMLMGHGKTTFPRFPQQPLHQMGLPRPLFSQELQNPPVPSQKLPSQQGPPTRMVSILKTGGEERIGPEAKTEEAKRHSPSKHEGPSHDD
jgi:hypothetical protein